MLLLGTVVLLWQSQMTCVMYELHRTSAKILESKELHHEFPEIRRIYRNINGNKCSLRIRNVLQHTGRGSPAQCTNRGHTKRRRDDGTDDRTVVQQSDGDGTVIRRDTDRTTGQCCSVHSIRGIRPILRCPLCLQNDAVACLVVEYHTEVRCSKRVR